MVTPEFAVDVGADQDLRTDADGASNLLEGGEDVFVQGDVGHVFVGESVGVAGSLDFFDARIMLDVGDSLISQGRC